MVVGMAHPLSGQQAAPGLRKMPKAAPVACRQADHKDFRRASRQSRRADYLLSLQEFRVHRRSSQMCTLQQFVDINP
jgi:hypothetical protein